MTAYGGYNANSPTYARVRAQSSNNSWHNGQRMRINYYSSSDYYTIAPVCSYNGRAKVLESRYSLGSSSEEYMWWNEYTGASKQQFDFEKQIDGSFIIYFKGTNYVLDVSGDYLIWNLKNGNATQKWRVVPDTSYNEMEEQYAGYNWLWPTEARYLTSSYGYRTLNSDVSFEFHSGVDVSPAYLTSQEYLPLIAPASGVVIAVGFDDYFTNASCGNYIIVETNDTVYGSNKKLQYVFMHMKSNVKDDYPVGTIVSAGEELGEMGNTGKSDGTHLHFAILTDEKDSFVDAISNRNFTNTAQPLSFYFSEIYSFGLIKENQ